MTRALAATSLAGFGPLSAVHQYVPPLCASERTPPLDSCAVAADISFTITAIIPHDTRRVERPIATRALLRFT